MVDFRELQDTESDYMLLVKWLNNQEVRKWYGFDDFVNSPSLSDIKSKYQKKVLNRRRDNPYIICIDNCDVGYIQFYETDEYLNKDNVYGIDLFIGEDNFRGKGYGSKVLRKITEYIFEKTSAENIIIDPDINNERAVSCYKRAGFRIVKEEDNHYIMLIAK